MIPAGTHVNDRPSWPKFEKMNFGRTTCLSPPLTRTTTTTTMTIDNANSDDRGAAATEAPAAAGEKDAAGGGLRPPRCWLWPVRRTRRTSGPQPAMHSESHSTCTSTCSVLANPNLVCLFTAQLLRTPLHVPSGDRVPTARSHVQALTQWPHGVVCSGLGLQKLKHKLALWIPLRHTNTELTWGTWAASALLICRDNSRHTARPWCGLCPAAAWRERGFVLFSAHCWVALGGTMEYEFVHPGCCRPQARTLPYTIRQPVPTPHQVAAVGQHRS